LKKQAASNSTARPFPQRAGRRTDWTQQER